MVCLVLKLTVGCFKGMHFVDLVQNHFEHFNIDGFGAEVIGSQGHGFEGVFMFGIFGNDDDFGGLGEFGHLLQEEAVC